MKVYITKVKNSSFEGYVYDDALPKKYQEEFELEPNREFTEEIKVEGEYSVEWDDDIPMPVVENVYLSNGNKDIEMNLDDLGNTLFDIEEEIAQSGMDSSWEEDRIGRLADRAYDDWKDRQYED